MKRIRVSSAVMICASLMALAACGSEDTASTAESAPSTSVPASSPAVSSAPSASAATGGTSGPGDKELCTSAKKIGEEMKTGFTAALQAGRAPTPAESKKVLTDMHDKLTALAATGGDSKVAAAMKQFAAEAAKAASATDPLTAADNPAYVKAGEDITAACRPHGVEAGF